MYAARQSIVNKGAATIGCHLIAGVSPFSNMADNSWRNIEGTTPLPCQANPLQLGVCYIYVKLLAIVPDLHRIDVDSHKPL